MRRREPNIQPPVTATIVVKKDENIIKQVRRYKLITPLFGGGVEAGVTDNITPISGKAIRGHLRFWWRATRGGQFDGSLERMKEAEEAIWGGASGTDKGKPSSVKVEVECLKDKKGNFGDYITLPRSEFGYVTFPLDDKKNKSVLKSLKFVLTISFTQDCREEIEAAVWSWETFGGIGARTRRGFGAIHLTSAEEVIMGISEYITIEPLPLTSEEIKRKLEDKLKGYIPENSKWYKGISHLERELSGITTSAQKGSSEVDGAESVWKYLIYKLKDFRQKRRNDGRGRSYWSEPERIRRWTEQRLDKVIDGRIRKHDPIPPKLDEFPRAAFGLPIIFQFKNGQPDDSNSDPRKTILQLRDHERLASPLILRPIICKDGRAAGIALIVKNDVDVDSLGIILKTKEGASSTLNTTARLDPTKAAMLLGPDGQPLLGDETDVLQAFLNTLKEGK